MTRDRLLMTALLVGAFVLGVLVPPVRYIGTAAPDAQPATVAISSIDFKYDEDGHVENVTIRHTDGVISEFGLLAPTPESPTPTPTHTATASSTPGTSTIAPIYTATATPTLDATPTRESTPLPTTTPAPTAIPKVCELRATTTIRIRFSPTTSAAITGFWQQGETRTFDQFWQPDESGYLWGHHADGWSAVYYWPGFEWLVAGTTEADLCRDVKGWPWNLAPPVPIARSLLGYHLLVSVSNAVLYYLDGVTVVKGLTGSYDMALAARQINPDITVICRSLHNQNGMIDGPLAWEWQSPEVYYAKLKPYLPDNCDFYEYINEWDSDDWTTRVKFDIAMLGYFTQDGRCALFGSFGPGNPPYEAWGYLVDVMRWIDDHPCQPGRYHGLAWHMAGHMPDDVYTLPNSYIRNIHITERDQFVDDVLRANTGYSLRDFKGPIYVTEFGWEDYTIPNQGFSCEQVRRGWRMSVDYFQQNSPYITGVLVWNFWSNGSVNNVEDGRWVDLTACLPLS